MTLTEQCVNWTKEYLNSFGGNTKAIIGISGGKDSSVAAAICVKAVGPDRVIGVLLPQGFQHDKDCAYQIVKHLGIKSIELNIGTVVDELNSQVSNALYQSGMNRSLNSVYLSNTPARIRMTALYGFAAIFGDSRVVNTCNRSEDFIGFLTKFGDGAGDFSPLGNLCVREVLQIGRDLGIPTNLIEKAPEDGLTGKTDEENLGFTYEELDAFLLDNKTPSVESLKRISNLRMMNMHKSNPMPTFSPKRGENS